MWLVYGTFQATNHYLDISERYGKPGHSDSCSYLDLDGNKVCRKSWKVISKDDQIIKKATYSHRYSGSHILT